MFITLQKITERCHITKKTSTVDTHVNVSHIVKFETVEATRNNNTCTGISLSNGNYIEVLDTTKDIVLKLTYLEMLYNK